MPGMSFGHAGTIVEGKEDTASEKIARLAAAGITVAERIEDIPDLVRQGIDSRAHDTATSDARPGVGSEGAAA
jgi:succinyl-CoA synthetase alpha subunit